MSSAQLHVVFGAGQIGSGVARALRSRGFAVRVVRRHAAPVGDGVEVVAGDAADADFARKASAGAAVLYHCMNPSSYTARAWQEQIPAMGESLIAAARHQGTRLVVLDNLYGHGVVDGARTEATPMRATGPKGRVRAAWAERLERAAREEGLRYTVGRAGDYFGPGTGDQTFLSLEVVRKLARGKRPILLGDPTARHAFSFAPDVVEALVALGTAGDDVEGQAFILPVVVVSQAELLARLQKALGVTTTGLRVRRRLLQVLSPVVPLFRELLETHYQWDRPFLADDSKIRGRFPGLFSSIDEVITRTVQAAQESPARPTTRPAVAEG